MWYSRFFFTAKRMKRSKPTTVAKAWSCSFAIKPSYQQGTLLHWGICSFIMLNVANLIYSPASILHLKNSQMWVCINLLQENSPLRVLGPPVSVAWLINSFFYVLGFFLFCFLGWGGGLLKKNPTFLCRVWDDHRQCRCTGNSKMSTHCWF